MKSFLCAIAVLAVSLLTVGDAAAVPITLNLVQQESSLTLTGFFSGYPFLPQDAAGTSNKTTYQGTITVDVDNLLTPTSIQLLSSAANADVSGQWLPGPQPYVDVDGGGPGDFPGDAVTSVGTVPGPATDADYGIKIRPPGAPDVAYSAQRDLEFDISTPGVEAVNGAGEFSSLTEKFKYGQGWYDYWLHPTYNADPYKIRQRLELAGGSNPNLSAAPSKFTVTLLPGNQKEYKLFIPVNVDDPDSTAPSNYAGQLVATLVVPEPSTLVLFGTATALAAAFAARRRK